MVSGTKEFIKRGTDFTVNIGLIENGVPTTGAVYASVGNPVLGRLRIEAGFASIAAYARRPRDGEPIRVRKLKEPPCAVASKSRSTPETEALLADAGVKERASIGSSMKFVLVAGGDADVHPRSAPILEDTAAGEAVLRGAGGRVFDLDGQPLVYGKRKFFNPGFVAAGSYEPAPSGPLLVGSHTSGGAK